MTKRYTVKLHSLDDSVKVVFTTEYSEYIKKYFPEYITEGEDLDDDIGGVYWDKRFQTFIVFDLVCCDENDLLHESWHAISKILRHKGVNLSDDTDEIYAYSLEYLYKNIIKNWKKVKEKINGGDSNKDAAGKVLQEIARSIKSDSATKQ